MYLKELRIHGFKSFADRTLLELKPGMTAIVGPNGCGKSNIADAIRWVLGEQSSKSLRAGSMQDVIFQGTDGRKPVNLCEVSLLFDECEKELGTAFHQVEVSRQVVRDGGSKYLLNGKTCRLKDIQRLFMDTGVGQVSYSFLVQGQIDQILSNNPAERRIIFEEAAGISKYKSQRREALLKLGHVDADLARITDVIEEVSRQIGSLKRQAAKALRYKRIKHRLSHLDLALHGYRYSKLGRSIQALEEEAEELRQKVAATNREIREKERGLEVNRGRRSEFYERMQSLQHTVFDLKSEKEQAGNQVEFASMRIQDFEERIEKITTEIADYDRQREELTSLAHDEIKTREEHIDLFESSDKIFQEKSREILAFQEKLNEAEDDLQNRRSNQLQVESSIARLRSNCTSLEVELRTSQVRHANLSEESYNLKNEEEIVQAELVELNEAFAQRQKEKETTEGKFAKVQEELSALRTRFRNTQMEIMNADRDAARLVAQTGLLENLQAKMEGFSEGAKAILKGKTDEIIPSVACRLLMSDLEIEARYDKALETLLGTAMDALMVPGAEVALALTDALNKRRLGRACLQLPMEGDRSLFPAEQPHPDWLIPARGKVGAKDKTLGDALDRVLDGAWFCPDLNQFMDFLADNPNFKFHLVATEKGTLIDYRGLIFGGHSGNSSTSFLQRRHEIENLKKELVLAEEKLTGHRSEAGKIQEELDDHDEKLEDLRRLRLELSEEISNIQAQQSGARQRLEKSTLRLSQLERELDVFMENREELEDRLEDARDELESGEDRIEAAREAITEGEQKVVALRHERDKHQENLSEARLQLAEKRQRLELLERGLAEIDKRAKELQDLKIRRQQEIDQFHEQIATLKENISKQHKTSEEIEKTLTVAQENLKQARTQVLGIEEAIKAIENGLGAIRDNQLIESEALKQREVELARQRSELNYLTEEVYHDYEKDLQKIQWRDELWKAGDALPDRIKVAIEDESPDDALPTELRPDPTEEDLEALEHTDWEEVSAEVKNLRERLHAMGAVNLVAIEEYSSLKERYEFLKTQSEDLWKAKNELINAIDEINATSQEMFRETFEQIRNNFKFTFETLFGGGHSDLILVDREDVLESGIDIIARPPGTRLKTLALLSGGQKTMTAVALLFAIYRVKPSPFCVLDELDAPLDDANVGRFVGMVQKFLEFSQFLIITHNKRTIAAADIIYGVTMQEKGVSKLVSLRFDKDSDKTRDSDQAANTELEKLNSEGGNPDQ